MNKCLVNTKLVSVAPSGKVTVSMACNKYAKVTLKAVK